MSDHLPDETRQRDVHHFVLAALGLAAVAAGAWFRIAGLFGTPLWLDEAYSAYAVEKGFAFTWTVVPTYDVHPPLYYTILGIWALVAGDSLVGLRLLGLLCGILAIAAAALAGRETARALGLDGRLLGIAAAGLVALAPLAIEMSREVRPYAVMMLVYAAAIGAVLRVAERAAASGRVARGPFLLYLVALALMFWLHNLGPLFGVGLVLALVVVVAGRVTEHREVFLLVVGHLLVALSYLPALLMLLDQAPTWVGTTWLTFRWRDMHWELAELWVTDRLVAVLAAALLVVVGTARALVSGGWRVVASLTIAAVTPVALAVALSVWVTPVFLVRTMTPVAIPALILIATGSVSMRGKWRWVAAACLAVILHQMFVVDSRPIRKSPRQDWYGAVRWLEERIGPGDVVYAYPNEGVLPFDRAVRDLGLSIPTRPIPTAVPAPDVGWHPMGNRAAVSLPHDELRAIAEEPGTKSIPTVWLLRHFPRSYDKDDAFLEEMSRDRIVVDRSRFTSFDIVGLQRIDE